MSFFIFQTCVGAGGFPTTNGSVITKLDPAVALVEVEKKKKRLNTEILSTEKLCLQCKFLHNENFHPCFGKQYFPMQTVKKVY